eukprot:1161013-Pelagomonas_calceolata.AAC.12
MIALTWSLVLARTDLAGANASNSSRKMMDGAQRLACAQAQNKRTHSLGLLSSMSPTRATKGWMSNKAKDLDAELPAEPRAQHCQPPNT